MYNKHTAIFKPNIAKNARLLTGSTPLSTTEIDSRFKIKGKFYVPIQLEDGMPRVAIISQLRLIDGKRLYQNFGLINKADYKNLKESVIALCEEP